MAGIDSCSEQLELCRCCRRSMQMSGPLPRATLMPHPRRHECSLAFARLRPVAIGSSFPRGSSLQSFGTRPWPQSNPHSTSICCSQFARSNMPFDLACFRYFLPLCTAGPGEFSFWSLLGDARMQSLCVLLVAPPAASF